VKIKVNDRIKIKDGVYYVEDKVGIVNHVYKDEIRCDFLYTKGDTQNLRVDRNDIEEHLNKETHPEYFL